MELEALEVEEVGEGEIRNEGRLMSGLRLKRWDDRNSARAEREMQACEEAVSASATVGFLTPRLHGRHAPFIASMT